MLKTTLNRPKKKAHSTNLITHHESHDATRMENSAFAACVIKWVRRRAVRRFSVLLWMDVAVLVGFESKSNVLLALSPSNTTHFNFSKKKMSECRRLSGWGSVAGQRGG